LTDNQPQVSRLNAVGSREHTRRRQAFCNSSHGFPAARCGIALHKFFCLSKDGFGAESVDHESVSGEPESVSGGAEGDFGDNHRSCDIRNDAVLDAMHFIDGIFIVARPG
jgi:hypothetical protein